MPDLPRRIFAGAHVRELRQYHRLTQRSMATMLDLSVSYLSQIESNDRPLTIKVLDALARHFPGEWTLVDQAGDTSTIVRATHAASDPSVADAFSPEREIERAMSRHPMIARRLIALHETVRRQQDQLRMLDDEIGRDGKDQGGLPWDEIRDWFHHHRNYIDTIDRAAESVGAGETMPSGGDFAERLLRHGIRVVPAPSGRPHTRRYDPADRMLFVDMGQPPETIAFALAHQLARVELHDIIDDTVRSSGTSGPARHLLSAGLANYAAGALMMPYTEFLRIARNVRHDIDRLRRHFSTSFEQTCHRLSTLQRPGASGIPFFFCRIDMAGNITKRHSATAFQFAQYGGNCPLWAVHEAVAIPDRIIVQLAETPDGIRYASMAKGLVKPSGSFTRPPRRYAVALGCEIEHASEFIYADTLQTAGPPTPIGLSCRICPREDCDQRAFPPAAADIQIDPDRRGLVPYTFT